MNANTKMRSSAEQSHSPPASHTTRGEDSDLLQLELEAADFFKLDQNQISLLSPRKQEQTMSFREKETPSPSYRLISGKSCRCCQREIYQSHNKPMAAINRQIQATSRSTLMINESSARGMPLTKLPTERQSSTCDTSPAANSRCQRCVENRHQSPARKLGPQVSSPAQRHNRMVNSPSTTTTTNSLPSVSSSPSVSPSLVCPHLSLDDILELRNNLSVGSPHTIGLCAKCRLDPPPNVQSPLSPIFKPFNDAEQYNDIDVGQERRRLNMEPKRKLRRGYSDHEASSYSERANKWPSAKRGGGRKVRDDSLDYYLEPQELRRLQMSPTMRNSVEFIRKNSTESGRVIRVYKNGCPYDKPLRICILRGEFSSMNHLLDHINGRQLIPGGARYLFHLDGQLVYSVHELKHGSIYIVSGTRNYDFRASSVLREQLERERQLQLQHHNRSMSDLTHIGLRQCERAPHNPHGNGSRRNSIERLSRPSVPLLGPSKGEPTGEGNVQKEGSQVARTNTGPRSAARVSTGRTKAPIGSDNKLAFKREQQTKTIEARESSVGRITRAKSELSAVPSSSDRGKRKKMVTFVDTGKGSSPAVGDLSSSPLHGAVSSVELNDLHVEEAGESVPIMKEMSTSEIGIQVSESIDGFLIDLPIELPAKGDDSNLASPRQRSRTFTFNRQRTNTGVQAGSAPERGMKLKGQRNETTKTGQNNGERLTTAKSRRQIVTITERQLSLDEMSQLMDLDKGDHHRKGMSQVTIKLEPAGDVSESDDETAVSTKVAELEEAVPDRTNTISIGKDPHDAAAECEQANEPANERRREECAVDRDDGHSDEAEEGWRYPGGRDASATPTERPVSQSDASDSVRARVTTPTPSLSTAIGGGDSEGRGESRIGKRRGVATIARGRGLVAPRPGQRVEVVGKLCNGLYEPARNFRLVWVNGLIINDQYPENSFNMRQQMAIEQQQQRRSDNDQLQQVRVSSRASTPTGGRGQGSLSPSSNALLLADKPNTRGGIQFRLSERFHNWVCHSRLHDELIYPAGNLVVLWCRWSNEQRYYSKHTANVSTVTLSACDFNLAASAQLCDVSTAAPIGKPSTRLSSIISAQIHLWSLTTLETLYVIEDDQLKTKRIFSMSLKNSRSIGCELSVCARDDKQLFLHTYYGDYLPSQLNKDQEDGSATAKQQAAANKTKTKFETKKNPPLVCTLRANKTLQQNQVPLALVAVIQQADKVSQVIENAKKSGPQLSPLISIGRRHFHFWAPEKKQQKFRLLQSENRNAKFVELLGKVSCVARLSPDEFLVGDSDGNVTLLIVDYRSQVQAQSMINGKKARNEAMDLPRYTLDTVHLCGPQMDQKPPGEAQSSDNGQQIAITCVTRVSGSIFACADSTCTMRFYRIQRGMKSKDSMVLHNDVVKLVEEKKTEVSCKLMKSLNFPPDLGFICSIVLANYDRRQSLVEFYIVSTSNTVLFGSLKLMSDGAGRNVDDKKQQVSDLEILSVVYEGHETAASSLVADLRPAERQHSKATNDQLTQNNCYFTCSLDCRICKWDGKQLIWKSLLPSSCVSLAIHPIGFVLAVGSIDGTVYILDKISGLLISYFPLTPICINCLAYSKDGALLAAGCANGSIFILPVYERGLKYKKVSIFQSPYPVVSLQFSVDGRYILTSVTHGSWQELILWDLPNFRYMRENVKLTADKIEWFDSICSGSEDVRAIWENANLNTDSRHGLETLRKPLTGFSSAITGGRDQADEFVVNLSCHRLIKSTSSLKGTNHQHLVTFDRQNIEPSEENFVIASDTRGYLRLFRYPCYDIQQGFYAIRISSLPVNCCRFLHSDQSDYFVSTSVDGTICLWILE